MCLAHDSEEVMEAWSGNKGSCTILDRVDVSVKNYNLSADLAHFQHAISSGWCKTWQPKTRQIQCVPNAAQAFTVPPSGQLGPLVIL